MWDKLDYLFYYLKKKNEINFFIIFSAHSLSTCKTLQHNGQTTTFKNITETTLNVQHNWTSNTNLHSLQSMLGTDPLPSYVNDSVLTQMN